MHVFVCMRVSVCVTFNLFLLQLHYNDFLKLYVLRVCGPNFYYYFFFLQLPTSIICIVNKIRTCDKKCIILRCYYNYPSKRSGILFKCTV